MEVDKLEVVELPLGQAVVEVLHGVPRPVPDADHHDTERDGGGLHDGVHGGLVLRHLAVGDDEQDVVGGLLLHDADGLPDERGEAGRPAQADLGGHAVVTLKHLAEALAASRVQREGEDAVGARLLVGEAEGGDVVVLVEGLQRAAHDGDDALVGVEHLARHDAVQALAVEGLAALPLVAGGEVHAHDQLALLQPRSPAGVRHLLVGREVVLEGEEGPLVQPEDGEEGGLHDVAHAAP